MHYFIINSSQNVVQLWVDGDGDGEQLKLLVDGGGELSLKYVQCIALVCEFCML